jgi:hypothetical protein
MGDETATSDASSTSAMDHSGHDMSAMPSIEKPKDSKPAASEDGPRSKQQTDMPIKKKSATSSTPPSKPQPATSQTDHHGH